MSDTVQIHNTLYGDNEEYVPTYLKESYAFIPDYNSGNYQTQLQYNTKDIKAKKIVWRDAFLSIPLVIAPDPGASTAGVYTQDTKLALKQSVLSLVHGLTMNTIGAGTVISDAQIQFINNLRLLLDNTADFLETKQAELKFGKDSVVWDSSNPNDPPIATAGTAVGENKGFLDRVTFIQMEGFSAGAFRFDAKIPLRLIHPVFDAMNNIVYGTDFELFVQLSFLSNNNYPPLMIDPASGATAVNRVIPKVSIAPNVVTRLYYKCVELHPQEDAIFTAKLAKGYKVRRNYLSCDVLHNVVTPVAVGGNVPNNPLNNSVVTNSVVNPVA